MYYSVLVYDEPDSASLRDRHRQAHLDYLKGFDDQTLFAGPFTSDDESADLGSFRLIDFADRATAEKHIADEPYVIGGVQKRWQLHRWEPALPYTWRDCPRTEGNIQMLFHGLDRPGGRTMREQSRDAQETYFGEHANSVMIRGPLLDDNGTQPVGDVWLLDAADLAAGRALVANSPFYRAGLYGDVLLHRWRFGRVFDRFKV